MNKILQIRIQTTEKFKYNKLHVSLLNVLNNIGLSGREIDVLSSFLSLDESIIDEDMFNPVARKKVMLQLGLKPGGLGNHLKSLITKGVLTKNKITNRIKLNPIFKARDKSQGYQILNICKNESEK